MSMVRWNPFREMAALQSAMDRLFEQNWQSYMNQTGSSSANMLALDVHENADGYTVTTALPGVSPENVQVRLDGNVLHIFAEIEPQPTENKEGQRVLMSERTYGQFARSITLPQTVNRNAVEAEFENGVLTLTLPKSPETKPQLIPVKTGSRLQGSNN